MHGMYLKRIRSRLRVGVVEKERIIDGSTNLPGRAVIGLASSGLHYKATPWSKNR